MSMTQTAIGYARVSTSKQADTGHSLDLQLTALKAEAQRHGWTFEGVTEEGSARSITGRPVLQDALKQLASGAASVLIVHRLDRLGRSLKDVLTIVADAERQGWRIVFTEQSIDSSTSTGRLMLGVLGTLGQYDNELRSERIKEGLAEARGKGVRLGRPLKLSEETASLVADLRASGLTLQAVADRLNADGVPTAHAAAAWYPSSVRAVIKARRTVE